MFRGRGFPQLLLAAILGVSSGVYVWKPVFQKEEAEREEAGPAQKGEERMEAGPAQKGEER
uniref:Uncharacterized protein n=2 Tax=Anolis carolinensis TaxID=28377 RepID=A0A803TQM4_ANOCA|nr:PREDICTED: protein PIGBOS1-like [Anolis carolinensis]|eukprot:XP_016854432.1 PREDICTED: protein PIGBOS1-like [Anolis carolinensis]